MSTPAAPTPAAPETQVNAQDETHATRILYALVLGVIFAALGLWIALTHHPSASLVVRYVLVGFGYMGVGYWLYARRQRAFGVLIAATGALWFAPELHDSNEGILVGVGILLSGVYLAGYAHSVLAYPDGSVAAASGRWLVRAAYFVTLVGGFFRMLTYQPGYWQSCDCSHNDFAIWHSEALYNAVNNTTGSCCSCSESG